MTSVSKARIRTKCLCRGQWELYAVASGKARSVGCSCGVPSERRDGTDGRGWSDAVARNIVRGRPVYARSVGQLLGGLVAACERQRGYGNDAGRYGDGKL